MNTTCAHLNQNPLERVNLFSRRLFPKPFFCMIIFWVNSCPYRNSLIFRNLLTASFMIWVEWRSSVDTWVSTSCWRRSLKRMLSDVAFAKARLWCPAGAFPWGFLMHWCLSLRVPEHRLWSISHKLWLSLLYHLMDRQGPHCPWAQLMTGDAFAYL